MYNVSYCCHYMPVNSTGNLEPGYINPIFYRCAQVGGTSQRAHVVGHPQFLIFHRVGAGEVELVEHLEIMHVSLIRDIPVEYL